MNLSLTCIEFIFHIEVLLFKYGYITLDFKYTTNRKSCQQNIKIIIYSLLGKVFKIYSFIFRYRVWVLFESVWSC